MLTSSPKRRILILGSSGRVGRVLSAAWQDVHDLLVVDLRRPPRPLRAAFVQADAFRPDLLSELCRGVDTVIPLAVSGNLRDDWDAVAPVNLTGIRAVFQAAAEAGCRRVIFPSSVQTAINPFSPYSSSKRWGEQLGARYAALTPLSVICLRLGAVTAPADPRIFPGNPNLDHVLTHPDLVRLFDASLEAPNSLNYAIFWGISANQPARFDVAPARLALGYQPQDNAFELARLAAISPRARLRIALWKGLQKFKKWLHL